MRLVHDSFVAYPTPRNLNYWWTFGAILTFCLVVQIVTGVVIAMHYEPSTTGALASVQRFKRDIPFGWLIQPIHSVGASMFFLAVYVHMFRGLYYGSYKAPREILWILGCIIYLLMIITAFLGYSLPWGQMSFWAATVITNLIGALPIVGEPVRNWLMGGFAIGNPTLTRFFSLHYLVPFVIVGVVVLHIWALHVAGQNNPTGVDPKTKEDTVPFTPHATMKDIFVLAVFLILFAAFVFYMPDSLGHPDNYIPANPVVTPPHIVPEWYLLPFYAILRAIDFDIIPGFLDSKLTGVLLMFASIGVLFILPWLDTSKVRSMRYRPVARWFFFGFVAACLGLGWCGAQNPALAIWTAAPFRAEIRWVEGGQSSSFFVRAQSAVRATRAFNERAAALKREGAQIVMINRSSPSEATLTAVRGGQMRQVAVQAPDLDTLEARIAERKSALGAANVPFAEIERRTPFVFTVTKLAQILTAYYFLFFLVVLPLLGLRETPRRVPESISKSALQGAV
jgi:ubiquinol-cytochrome c reductase cytochrome b subunit